MDITGQLYVAVSIFCLFVIAFAYLGYPVSIYAFSKIFGQTNDPHYLADEALPSIALLIAAHNEEKDIRARIENALAMDYPADRLTIVIASDGSTDGTNDIVREYLVTGRVRLLEFSSNRGKAAVLDSAVPSLDCDLVVLSDANTTMRTDAVRRLASWFVDPKVGAVCGRLVLTDPKTGTNVDSIYWKYETFLKKCESKLGALLGSNGAIYAIRKSLFPGVPPGTIIDDFYIPLEAKRRSGCQIVYDSHAVACEETAPNIRAEFRRRVRIGAGGFQIISRLWKLLLPANGWVAFAFLCHKLLRWFCPFLMIVAFLANLLALDSTTGSWLFAMQLVGYSLAIVGNWVPARPRALKLLKVPTMFVSMNIALLVGFFQWLFIRQSGVWQRTERATPMAAPQSLLEKVTV